VEPLPVYSPDLTPIEEMFSKIKAGLRTIAARSIETVVDAMGKALETVTPEGCDQPTPAISREKEAPTRRFA
jgi:transposase